MHILNDEQLEAMKKESITHPDHIDFKNMSIKKLHETIRRAKAQLSYRKRTGYYKPEEEDVS